MNNTLQWRLIARLDNYEARRTLVIVSRAIEMPGLPAALGNRVTRLIDNALPQKGRFVFTSEVWVYGMSSAFRCRFPISFYADRCTINTRADI